MGIYRLRWLGLLVCLMWPVLTPAAATTSWLSAGWSHPAGGLHFVRLQADKSLAYWLWQPGEGWQQRPLPAEAKVPLGSVWKLFVDAWLRDTQQSAPAYTCNGKQFREEVYCCKPGESIEQDAALLQSCGLFFSPRRLGIQDTAWRRYWQQAGAPGWLQNIQLVSEDTVVPVRSLLEALDRIPAEARRASERTLMALPLSSRGESTLPYWGTRIRAKTWSMPKPDRPGESMGGFAGWQADGAAVWLMGEGSSRAVLSRAGQPLAALLQDMASASGPCVEVRYFARYPLRKVTDASGKPARVGALKGRYTVSFVAGTQVEAVSEGELLLTAQPSEIHGRMSLNEYVARVVDREGEVTQPHAARALAVLARTYLLQQGKTSKTCYQIDDSSSLQRVSPRPASAGARDAANLTDNLVLAGMAARYHSDNAAEGRLSWQEALDDARQGMTFDAILARRFEQASLSLMDGLSPSRCEPLPQAQRWLEAQALRWQSQLQRQPGYEPPEHFQVCRLMANRPYSDFNRLRIYVRGLQSQEDRITLAHEYVHLAFAQHPTGENELLVEKLARQLVGVNP